MTDRITERPLLIAARPLLTAVVVVPPQSDCCSVVIDTVVRGDSIDAAMVSRPPEHQPNAWRTRSGGGGDSQALDPMTLRARARS